MVLAEKVKKMFHEEGIHSTTIQPEFVELEVESVHSDENCILDCPSNDDCAANTCCGPSNNKQVKDHIKKKAKSRAAVTVYQEQHIINFPDAISHL